ncbi:peptidoglycan editing factor PgeF [Lapillicoccus sp.]|uniref:peptidoglycan editing factor PgeF n=1 Tax=Lapillicoccus sp. TaxID=1909287 RepID=UPI0039832C02
MYYWSDEIAPSSGRRGLRWGFTSRRGGVSAPPHDELNLGGRTGDDPDAVARNREVVASSVGVTVDRLLFMDQCHGTDVVVVDGPWAGSTPPADGMVTTRDDLALAVLVADCVPVLLADRVAGVVGVVHAGRPGMTARIVDEAVASMRALGALRIIAAVGPSVCGRCYEVPAAMRDAAADVSPVSATVSWSGTPAIDVAAGVVDQLRGHDVAVTWVPGCSREDERLYSYRQTGQTGRFAGVVRLGPLAATA